MGKKSPDEAPSAAADIAGCRWDASDSDSQHELEVTFSPSTSNYRRKSSMVPSESRRPRHRNPEQKRTECLVHQFLECERRAKRSNRKGNSDEHDHTDDSAHDTENNSKFHQHAKSSQSSPPKDGPNETSSEDSENHPILSLDTPNSNSERTSIHKCIPDSVDLGQEDEKKWAHEMRKRPSQPPKSRSALDLEAMAAEADDEETHSRLLTKKQLSEMAWGVRQLSRRLGSMRIKSAVKTIFLLTKPYDQDLLPKTRELTKWLLHKDRGVRYVVYVQNSLRDNKKFDAPGLVDELHKDYTQSGEKASATAAADEDDDDGEESSEQDGRCAIARRLRYWDERMCRTRPHMFDFVITLGGDGTVLYASWLFQRIVPPVLSFALGSLGFMTKFDFSDYKDIITNAFKKGVTVSLRLRFEGTVMRSQRTAKQLKESKDSGDDNTSSDQENGYQKKDETSDKGDEDDNDDDDDQCQRDLVEELIGEEKDDIRTHKPDATYEILNEVVVDRGPNPTLSNLEIFGDDEHFTTVLADGICVSTPTGSTAYNLAAGGSLCHPENPVMLVTSICAHTLSFRPIILPDTIVLRVGVPYDSRTSSWANFDGREHVELRPGDYVTISASRYPFASVLPEDGNRSEDWINSICGKLGWNTRQKQKSNYKAWDK